MQYEELGEPRVKLDCAVQYVGHNVVPDLSIPERADLDPPEPQGGAEQRL
ncbi:MAG: hypothetical protein ACR2JH_02400 [Solirubrobacteraceae bacterium]